MNDTRVSALRLIGAKETGGSVEAVILSRQGENHLALMRPGRRLPPGTRVLFGDLASTVVANAEDGMKLLRFDPHPDLESRLNELGQAPLPPYVHERLADRERYQTVYNSSPGSAAAPTAGLHFTPEIFAEFESRGVAIARVTLHVGLDTFRPVHAANLDDHRMHGELCTVPPETAELVATCTGRIIAVGTTTVRTLESFATGTRSVRPGTMNTTLFVRPGYDFKVVDGIITNFHLPSTTMLVMISAFCGRCNVLNAYQIAIEDQYRFLSFGDSMLVL